VIPDNQLHAKCDVPVKPSDVWPPDPPTPPTPPKPDGIDDRVKIESSLDGVENNFDSD
jgi:hypothetical protein